MTRYLTVDEVMELHRLLLEQSGGLEGVRDLGGLQSAVAQPSMTFGGRELYADLAEKGAALAFSLIRNHHFLDGNKRIGHAAMETFLMLNGWELESGVDEQEQVILRLAAGKMDRVQFTTWAQLHLRQRRNGSKSPR
jgi:death on curing protein